MKVTQLCPALCDPMDCIAHGILQARILEWVAFPFSRGSSKPRSPALQADSLPAEPQGKPKNTGVGSLSPLQRIFLTHESNRDLLRCRQILYQLSYEGSQSFRNLLYSGFRPLQGLLCTSLVFRSYLTWPPRTLFIGDSLKSRGFPLGFQRKGHGMLGSSISVHFLISFRAPHFLPVLKCQCFLRVQSWVISVHSINAPEASLPFKHFSIL